MRTSFVRTFAIAALAALALAACGSSSKNSSGSSPTTAAAPATTAAEASPTTTASSAAPTVKLAAVTSAKVPSADKVLVDDKGMTLYMYEKDPAGKVTCTGACATAWPPYYVTGTPTFGDGVTGSQFTTITTPDGKQLAVNGHALYHWAGDTKAGDASGQDVNSFYVVGTNGQKVEGS